VERALAAAAYQKKHYFTDAIINWYFYHPLLRKLQYNFCNFGRKKILVSNVCMQISCFNQEAKSALVLKDEKFVRGAIKTKINTPPRPL